MTLRRKNIIVYGLKENPENDDPKALVNDIVSELEVNIDVDIDCESVFRLGKKAMRADKPRPIRIKFNDITKKVSVLAASKKLRNVQRYKDVYLNPDLTPKQQEMSKNLRDMRNKLKKRSENAGKKVYIWRNSVYVGDQRVDEKIFH